jgi:hypothetical protein
MITKRFDAAAIFGVPFSKNYDLDKMKSVLKIGIKATSLKAKDLAKDLIKQDIVLEKLSVEKLVIQKEIKAIQTMEATIESLEGVFKSAVLAYETANHIMVGLIGKTPGSQPPLPTASGISTPLIASIKTTEQMLAKQKADLAEKRIALAVKIEEQSVNVKKVGIAVEDLLASFSPIQYDSEVQQFIYI